MKRKAWRDIQCCWVALLVLSTMGLYIINQMFLSRSTKQLQAINIFYDSFNDTGKKSIQEIQSRKENGFKIFNQAAKWIVLDGTPSSPCSNVTNVTSRGGWGVVVVSDTDNSNIIGCRRPLCLVLNRQTYHSLLPELKTTRMLKKPDKLSGFLLAMSLGAEVIMDAKCDAYILSNTSHQSLWEFPQRPQHFLFYNNTKVFNPFQHFNHDTYYPTLFDYTLSSSLPRVQLYCKVYKNGCEAFHTNTDFYQIVDFNGGGIWQTVLINYGRYSGSYTNKEMPFGKRASRSPVSIGHETLAPLDTGPTLFHRNAFPLMFVPLGLSKKLKSIFRTLFVFAMRSNNNPPVSYLEMRDTILDDLYPIEKEKQDQSLDVENIMKLKSSAYCHKAFDSKNMFQCSIGVVMNILNLLTSVEPLEPNLDEWMTQLFLAWTKDIRQLEVKRSFSSEKVNSISGKGIFKIKLSIRRNIWEDFTLQQKSIVNKTVFDQMHKVCENLTSKPFLTPQNWESPMSEDIALIVVLNYEFLFPALPYLEYLHRSSFRHIIYCGPNMTEFIKYAWGHGYHYVTYVDGFSYSWYFMYECMSHAMKLGLPVKGYLQIGDDVLVNTRKLLTLPRDRIWMPKGFARIYFHRNQTGLKWSHWETPFGESAVLSAIRELKTVAAYNSSQWKETKASQEYQAFCQRFLVNYHKAINGDYVIHRAMDLFYIPDFFREDYLMATELFKRNKCMIELAIPIIHLGLAPFTEILYLNSSSLWGNDRIQSWKYYNEKYTYFIHPFKSLSQVTIPEGRQFFCRKFLPHLVNSKT